MSVFRLWSLVCLFLFSDEKLILDEHYSIIILDFFLEKKYIFFKILFLYSRESQREKQRHRQREKQDPCGEPDGALDPRTLGS